MVCPKCGGGNVRVQVVTEVRERRKKGLLYWLFIGWWWEIIAWVFFTLPKLLFAIFSRKTKIVTKSRTVAVCQSCGKRWNV